MHVANRAFQLSNGAIPLCLALIGTAGPTVAAAQVPQGERGSGVLEEIVVTAQKREQREQDVPISISTLSASDMDDVVIQKTQDLQTVVPGLIMNNSGVGSVIFMRGLGSTDAAGGAEASVATYVDGFWYGAVTGSIINFNNIERVEVLKGPQGTLFGRNTTGGVINIITKDPSRDTSAKLGMSYGNYQTAGANLYATTGITQNIAADIAVNWDDQGKGYGTNVFDGTDTNQSRHLGARTKWKYSGERTEVTFSFDYADFSDNLAYSRHVPEGGVDLAGDPPLPDFQDVNMDSGTPEADFRNYAAIARIRHSFDSFDLVSITGYKNDKVDSRTDNDESRAPIMDADIDFYNKALSQEFQLLSSGSGGNTWIVGLYALDQEAGSDIIISGAALWPALNDLRFFGDIKTKSYAVFGEYGWQVAPADRLTFGARYTRDEREIDGGNQFFLYTGRGYYAGTPTPALATPHQEATFKKPTFRFVYDHKFQDNIMGYASYNRGFRSGNFNAVAPADAPVNPEVVDAYEIGLKSELLDGRLRVNGALYEYRAKGLQVVVQQGVTTANQNAAEATIRGVELDMAFAASPALTIDSGVSVTDGEYDEYPGATSYTPNVGGGNTGRVIDASGNTTLNTPKVVASLGLTHDVQLGAGTITSSIRGTYNDGFFWESDNRLKEPAFTIVNLSVAWTDPQDIWDVRVYGKNVLDEEYAVTKQSSNLGDWIGPAPPRTYGVAVTRNF